MICFQLVHQQLKGRENMSEKNNFNGCYFEYQCLIDQQKYCKYYEIENDNDEKCKHLELDICYCKQANAEILLDELLDYEFIDNEDSRRHDCSIDFICLDREKICEFYKKDWFTGACEHMNIINNRCENKLVIEKSVIYFLKQMIRIERKKL